MDMVKKFEELEAWQLANELKQTVYELLRASKVRTTSRFYEQLTDSAASAPANLSEGFGYYRHPEFARQTRTAKSSLMETQNHLLDGVDRGFWTRTQADHLLSLADRAIGKCVRLLAHLETSDAPGTEPSPSARRAKRTFSQKTGKRKPQKANRTAPPQPYVYVVPEKKKE